MKFDPIDTDTKLIPFERIGMQPAITRSPGMEITHKPTGIKVVIPPDAIAVRRSQHAVRQLAMEALEYMVSSI